MIDEIKAKQKMIEALYEKKYDVVKVLMEIGTNLHYTDDRTPFLYIICKNGDDELIRSALSFDVLVGETLIYAYTNADMDVIEILLSVGVDINEKAYIGNTLLHKAAMKGDIEMIKYLLSKGADVSLKNELGNTPAYCAKQTGHFEAVELLSSKS